MNESQYLRSIIKKLLKLLTDEQLKKAIKIVEGLDVWNDEDRDRIYWHERIKKLKESL